MFGWSSDSFAKNAEIFLMFKDGLNAAIASIKNKQKF